VGSRAVNENGKRVNEAFVWTREGGVVSCPHTKQHIPQSDGFYEQTWTEQGQKQFEVTEVAGLRIGFMICTDIMFPEHAREYGRQGANLIVCPRATPPQAVELFRSGMHMAANVSGCYVATSNRGISMEQLVDPKGGAQFEGRASIINPTAALVAQTNPLDPIVVAEVDTDMAAWKQQFFPCDLW
jgi:N-carbamoylputrescine amidase